MKLNNDDVYTPRPESPSDNTEDVRGGDAVFTLRGNHDYMWDGIPATNRKDTSGLACAKKVKNHYYLKVNNKLEIFNPLDDTHVSTSSRVTGNLPIWRYIKVSYSTFAHYAHFLKTRNTTYLTLARREMTV